MGGSQMTENQKLALIAAAAPNTVLRWDISSQKYFADDIRHYLEPNGATLWSGKAIMGLANKGLLSLDGEHEGWRITEAGRRAVEEMAK